MKKLLFGLLLFFLICFNIQSQTDLRGEELLNKAINYHDPTSQWSKFNNSLNIITSTNTSSDRKSEVTINIPEDYFYLKSIRDSLVTEYTISDSTCKIVVNGNQNLDSLTLKKRNISCDRGKMFRNYYTYLYGLPMKLKDKGTIIDEKVYEKEFKGQTYLVLKITYDEQIGKDTWYFYFNPKTYALELYQFYHDESLNDGEYIILSGETIINNIKIPKKRDWFYNSNNEFLGSDLLTN